MGKIFPKRDNHIRKAWGDLPQQPQSPEEVTHPMKKMFITGGLAVVLALPILAAGLEPATAQDQPSYLQPPNTHYQTALADLKGGNTDKAALEVKIAIQENPLDAASHFLLGGLLERNGERDQAIVAYQRAVALDPTNPDALYNLGTMLLRRGEVVPASLPLEHHLRYSGDHPPDAPRSGLLGRAEPKGPRGVHRKAPRLHPGEARHRGGYAAFP
jgi:tetratricopeptide (TPR) repeat protein